MLPVLLTIFPALATTKLTAAGSPDAANEDKLAKMSSNFITETIGWIKTIKQ